jgi:hypothetical protein
MDYRPHKKVEPGFEAYLKDFETNFANKKRTILVDIAELIIIYQLLLATKSLPSRYLLKTKRLDSAPPEFDDNKILQWAREHSGEPEIRNSILGSLFPIDLPKAFQLRGGRHPKSDHPNIRFVHFSSRAASLEIGITALTSMPLSSVSSDGATMNVGGIVMNPSFREIILKKHAERALWAARFTYEIAITINSPTLAFLGLFFHMPFISNWIRDAIGLLERMKPEILQGTYGPIDFGASQAELSASLQRAYTNETLFKIRKYLDKNDENNKD